MPGTESPALFSIGHSTRSIDELLMMLREAGVQLLLDVRSIPRSRRFPQFNREALAQVLADTGIAYRHLPGLGGRRQPSPDSPNLGLKDDGFRGYADYMMTADFQRELDGLIALAKRQCTAMMCAERDPAQCHRSLIADALSPRGFDVFHLATPNERRLHVMTPAAVVDGGRVTYPFALHR